MFEGKHGIILASLRSKAITSMGTLRMTLNPLKLLQFQNFPFLRENKKILTQAIITILFLSLGIWFLKHERTELAGVRSGLAMAGAGWIIVGIAVTGLYILLQGLMYVAAFRATGNNISLADSVRLFLKRNFVSVFLPAGGVSALAFFTSPLEHKGISKTQIHYASSLYGFVGIVSVVLVAIPSFLFGLVSGSTTGAEWLALGALLLLTGIAWFLFRHIMGKGPLYHWLTSRFPSLETLFEELLESRLNNTWFALTVLISVLIEITGMAHLYIAMLALHMKPLLFAAVMGYVISVIFLVVSPFLRGLGAIEVSMAIILYRFGFSHVEAISITLLYRFFEFWLPLLSGLASFLAGIRKLLMRVVPALMVLLLGVVNIISAITPAITTRMEILEKYLLLDIIHVSNYFVLVAGVFLLVTAAFMLKGMRSTWWLALILSAISLAGHITKAIDYEEAGLALINILLLVFTQREYYVKSHPRIRNIAFQTALWGMAAILAYGTIGFFLLDKKHFAAEFNLLQSIRYSLSNFFLIGNPSLTPRDVFARDFLASLNIGGFVSIAVLLYTFLRPYVYRGNASKEEFEHAETLVKQYGTSGLDYFKTCPDKCLFLEGPADSLISYRIAGGYAVALEGPVAPDPESRQICIRTFDRFCYENSMKSVFFRVPETDLPLYAALGKKSLLIGQEGTVDLNQFSLEGGRRKWLRNLISRTREKGYKTTIHQPPVRDGLLQKIKSVSDEWLTAMERSELVFSQFMFSWEALKQQTLITVENAEEKVVAFLNIIPDYAPGESTYDLMRKTADAPSGIMDFLMVAYFDYLRSLGIRYVNLGFAPLSGMVSAQSLPEKSMRFAYEKIRSFAHYRGLRDFKDKYDPAWTNRYLVYDHDYDLIRIPAALSRVIKP